MKKKLSYKTISILMIIGGAILIILSIVGYNNISKLGLTPEEYDVSRDVYINMMFGGGRATSGSFFTDLVMDERVTFLWVGIPFLLIGAIGLFYFTKHPEKDNGAAPKQQQPTSNGMPQRSMSPQTVQSVMTNMSQKAGPAIKEMVSVQNASGLKKIAIILAIASSICFILGIGIFPYSLLSIAAGVSLLYVLWKRDVVKTYLMLLPAALFMARFLISESSYSGYDWITVLYRVLGYGEIALIFIMNWGELRFIELEDDDVHLLSRCTVLLSLVNTVLSFIELTRGFSYGFSLVMFRLGSIPFWIAFALYYMYAQKPAIQTKENIYAGKQPHPYHTISGSVRNFMLGIYAAALACFIAGPWLISYFLNMLRSSARSGIAGYAVARALSGMTLWVMIVGGGILILAGLFLLWLNRKFRLRRSCFLLYYEYACFAIVIVSIMTIFCANVLLGIVLTIVSLAISYFTIKWLTTSVRVRTYMGSDQYLRQGLFTKKLPSPVPADEGGMGQAAMTQSYSQQAYPVQHQATPVRSVTQPTVQPMGNSSRNRRNEEDEWEMQAPPNQANRAQMQSTGSAMQSRLQQQSVSHRAQSRSDDEWELVEVPNEEDLWEEVPAQTTSYAGQTGYTQQSNFVQQSSYMQTRIPIRPDTCCICANPLYQGHAVIFTYQSGDEARVDEPCWNMINALVNTSNPSVMTSAAQHAAARIPFVDPAVADYLQQRIDYANSNMNPGGYNSNPHRRRRANYDL